MMSLPFLLFACGLAAAWTSRREAAMGFWVAGVLVLLVLFRFHATDVLNLERQKLFGQPMRLLMKGSQLRVSPPVLSEVLTHEQLGI